MGIAQPEVGIPGISPSSGSTCSLDAAMVKQLERKVTSLETKMGLAFHELKLTKNCVVALDQDTSMLKHAVVVLEQDTASSRMKL